jgi:hypothetical protein
MARLLQRALMSEGYSVALAHDGEQALSMGLSGGLDLMVLDVMLPRRDGFDVIRTYAPPSRRSHDYGYRVRRDGRYRTRTRSGGGRLSPASRSRWTCCWRGARSASEVPRHIRWICSSNLALIIGPRVTARREAASLARTEYALLDPHAPGRCIVPRDVLIGRVGAAARSATAHCIFIGALRTKIARPGERQFTLRVGSDIRCERKAEAHSISLG